MSSNLNDFNSKVNLPKVLQKVGGYDQYNIQAIIPFGEFVYNNDFTKILNALEVFKNVTTRAEQVYKKLVKEWPELLNQEVIWHQYTEKQIQAEDANQMIWKVIIDKARNELVEHKYVFEEKKFTLAERFLAQGNEGVVINGFGHLSKDLLNEYKYILDSKIEKYKKPIIVPYYHTPSPFHISYVEVFEAFDPDLKRERLYEANFHGFTGTRGVILPNFKALMNREGCLWDYTLDYWNNKPVLIDSECEIENLLEIIKTNRFTKFEIDPVDIIKNRHLTPHIYNNLRSLKKEHVIMLSEKLELNDLMEEWLDIQNYQYMHGKTTYYKRKEGYFSSYKGNELQLTNFVLNYKGFEKKEKVTYFILEAVINKKSVVLSIPESIFESKTKFELFLIKEFYKAGLPDPKFFTKGVHALFKFFIFHWFENQKA